MKYVTIASSLLVMAGLPGVAHATQVYPGCAAPSLKAGHHTFYVDPVKGSNSGDGSAAKPWHTFADVLAAGKISTMGHKKVGGTDPLVAINPNGPVKAGDVIMLMSGNHGSIALTNYFNTDFVTVMAAPGQTPVISNMIVKSSSKWLFQGIKFQSAETPVADPSKRSYARLVSVGQGDWIGATDSIAFDSDSFSSADNTTGWTDNDWLTRTKYYALSMDAPCVSVTNSSFSNVLNAIMVDRDTVLVQGNMISKFSNDGIELVSSNVTIKGNTIKDGTNVASSPWHADGIQGWSLTVNGTLQTNQNDVIDGNTIIKYGDPNKSSMQGVSIYDGKWNNLTVQNNVIAVNLWNALVVSGASNSKIVNNSVVATEPVNHTSWIRVATSAQGATSSDVTVRNNISPSLTIADTSVTYDHNIVGGMYQVVNAGKTSYVRTSDTTRAMLVVPSLDALFDTVNNSSGAYDLRLKSTASVLGKGSTTLMPQFDITGKTRTSPVDPGAYTR